MKTPSPTRGLFSFIIQIVWRQPWRFILIYFLSIAWAIESTVWPYLLRLIIDRLTRFDLNLSLIHI